VSAQDSGLACRLGQGPRAATPGHRNSSISSVSTASLRTSSIDSTGCAPGLLADELAETHQITTAARPWSLPGIRARRTTCLAAVRRSVTKDLRGLCM
jgi:hypothetical protein